MHRIELKEQLHINHDPTVDGSEAEGKADIEKKDDKIMMGKVENIPNETLLQNEDVC